MGGGGSTSSWDMFRSEEGDTFSCGMFSGQGIAVSVGTCDWVKGSVYSTVLSVGALFSGEGKQGILSVGACSTMEDVEGVAYSGHVSYCAR